MHAIVFIPAVIFVAVSALCGLVCTIIDHRAAAAARRRVDEAIASRPVFRPVLIQGGLKTVPSSVNRLRAAQSPLRSAGAALAARSA